MGHHQKNQHVYIMGIPKGKVREKGTIIWKKKKAENFLNLMKYMNINFKEAQWTPSRMNSKAPISKHIIIKLSKHRDKEGILKAAKKSNSSHTKDPHKNISMFFIRSFGSEKPARFRVPKLKKVTYQSRIPYLAKLFFKSEKKV